MTTKEELTQLLTKSFHFQKVMFRAVSWAAAVTGAILFVLTFVMPVKPGEEGIVQIMRIVSVIFVVFGWFFSKYIDGRIQQVQKLLFQTPDKISYFKPVMVQKNGIPAFAIRIYTKDNKMIGFNVTGPKTQQRLLVLLKEIMPQVQIKD